MSVRNLVLRVDGHRERFDCRQMESVHFAEMFVAVFDAPHRGLEVQIRNDEQWHDDQESAWGHVAQVGHDEGGNRCAAEVVDRQPPELRPPDMQGQLVGFEPDNYRDQPAVQYEVQSSERRQRQKQFRQGNGMPRVRLDAGEEEEDRRRDPDRNGRRREIEQESMRRPPFGSHPEDDGQRVEKNRDRSGRSPEQEDGDEDERFGNGDAGVD